MALNCHWHSAATGSLSSSPPKVHVKFAHGQTYKPSHLLVAAPILLKLSHCASGVLHFEDFWEATTSHMWLKFSPFTTSWGPIQRRSSIYLQNQLEHEWEKKICWSSIGLSLQRTSKQHDGKLRYLSSSLEILKAASLQFFSLDKFLGSQLLTSSCAALLSENPVTTRPLPPPENESFLKVTTG